MFAIARCALYNPQLCSYEHLIQPNLNKLSLHELHMRKKLIEVALPLDAINAACVREKNINQGHLSGLHLWWARQPLAAARAVIFASLVDDPDDPSAPPEFVEACRALPIGENATRADTPRMRLFDFIERLVTWEATTDERLLAQARRLIRLCAQGDPPPVYDPFAGGGTIPLEAMRLGLPTYAADLNPVAALINKAQIEIPQRFAGLPPVNPEARKLRGMTRRGYTGLADDVRYYARWMRDRAQERIGQFYPTHNGETVIAWLWARTVKSPNPAVNAPVPLARTFILSKKKDRECWARPIVDGNRVRFEIVSGTPPEGEDGTVNRKGGRCLISGAPIPLEYIRAEGRAGRLGAMLMAIVTEGQGGRNYCAADDGQEQLAQLALPAWYPTETIDKIATVYSVQNYGMDTYSKLFAPRQLLALTTFSELLAAARAQICADAAAAGLPEDEAPLREGGRGARAYAEALSIYLAFVVDKATAYWSTISTWSTLGVIRNTFTRQAISITWDYVEANPFSESSGNWLNLADLVSRAIERLPLAAGGAIAICEDASDACASFPNPFSKIIVTGPPYYDNISYAELSDFFYVWLRRALREVYPDLLSPILTPKAPELIAHPRRHGGRAAATRHYEDGMKAVFGRLYGCATPEYPMTIFYAYKQQELFRDEDDADDLDDADAAFEATAQLPQRASTGWETMLRSLIDSGFSVVGTLPMRTERASRVSQHGNNALAASIALICRPRPADAPAISRREFLKELRQELPEALRALQAANIAPVDLAQASIGPGMAVYSRYSSVQQADGTPIGIREALGMINALLDEYLDEQDSALDAETRFAVEWFKQRGFEAGDYGTAEVLARAKNVAVARLEEIGLLQAKGGKARLRRWQEYDLNGRAPAPEQRGCIWTAAHHLAARLQERGERGAAECLRALPSETREEARLLAYRLYNICEQKAWAQLGQVYNELVVSWSGIIDALSDLEQQDKQKRLELDAS
jgi:putative DNA methylase